MAIIRKSELKTLSKEELLKKLNDLELNLIKERGIRPGQGAKTKIKEIRRNIAKIKTILRLKYNLKE
ncbi:MAG: 50S ribosomal protein L29 [Candidatus Pacearchaeota archaeon]